MRTSHALASLVLAVAALAGCAEHRFAGAPAPTASAAAPAAAESAAVTGDAPDAGASQEKAWIEAVRLERWAEAGPLLDALPEATRALPEMRYVRARAAVGVQDGARALPLLDKLEASLPLLAADIERWRAEAQLLAGPPHASAGAAYLARSTRARDLTRAAAGYEKGGDLAAARATADRAVAAAARGKSRREEAAARLTRARIAEAQSAGAVAEADYRWVATRAGGSEAKAAAEALSRMKKPLSDKEKAALAEPPGEEEAAPAKPKPPARGEVLHTRGMALYKARSYLAAARTLREAAAARSGHEAEDLHYAARALARADHDEEAIKGYREVARRYPRSPFADRSAYQAARLTMIGGRFKEAAELYAAYLGAFRKGEHREEAEYERALSLLSSGGAPAARRSLEAQARKAGADKGARLRELAGVAALRAGDKAGAIAAWSEVARTQPLTWAALAARARLASVGAALPPVIEPPAAARPASPLELRLPGAAALLSQVGLDGDAEAHLAAAEREVSAAYAGREGEALCGLYGLLSRGKRRYRLAQSAVEGSWLMRAPSSTERWAWECVYPAPFASGVRALEEQHALPRGLIHALMRQESAFDPAVVSPAAAVGLMQLIPSTARAAAGELSLAFEEDDLTRPDVNLRLGAFYIAKLVKMFGGNVTLAAAAYNAGPRAVSHWLAGGVDNEVDLFVARIPYDETRTYVARVAQNLSRYQWLAGGDAAVAPLSLEVPAGVRAPPDAY